ncbi:hypothetical protein FJ444_07480 [Aestuariibacter sp. GS-14]|uniref:hypothetical protein n=1 Tax=Aestuariibacter sp. GS-14 TaxID=2590670 RepID=UPI00112DBDDC|nr:hypothetical protein [Aestuariibacter sp. GS-14]TPV59986.1 hypothetical protein FJ444_07480 [Aestuariibacter sp. GS-14]
MKKLPAVTLSVLLVNTLFACNNNQSQQTDISISPVGMKKTGSISERFLAYNVEMVEVTGGRFWAPYKEGKAPSGDERYEYRPPIDLTNARLQKMAAGLAPSYVRFSGTWANATYFANTDTPPSQPPSGFDAILTRQQWQDAVNFAQIADAEIVLSLATSAGARDANGHWQADNATQLLEFTDSLGATIAGLEFANEPNMIGLTQPPENYSPSDYHRDYSHFYDWIKQSSPTTLVMGPGAVEMGEPMRTMAYHLGPDTFQPEELLSADTPKPDIFSFHYYGASSQRCHIPIIGSQPEDAFELDWLASIDDGINKSTKLRDRFAPNAPLWISESGETACGGNPWATTFDDTYRFVDQLARSAQQGVQVFMHNTLAASDYALLDEHDFTPRPNYWAAWVWRNLMGTAVLNPGIKGANIYAHCHRNITGAVTVLAVNIQKDKTRIINVDAGGTLYTLTAAETGSHQAAVNGIDLTLGEGDSFPELKGKPFSAGQIELEPVSVNFMVFEEAGNPSCG